jgi:hypothetical protein
MARSELDSQSISPARAKSIVVHIPVEQTTNYLNYHPAISPTHVTYMFPRATAAKATWIRPAPHRAALRCATIRSFFQPRPRTESLSRLLVANSAPAPASTNLELGLS